MLYLAVKIVETTVSAIGSDNKRAENTTLHL